ncbi:helix-turn-helix transcriptional regulator [Escherichia coli]|nr:helix-turn-helix transcriptional regulator [Escherichia coli]EMA4114018.1 helix-turn-helix transcriptional regulator [Escherichia coli]HDX9295128.1 helix-turn-helix transcriptional regulator [Escherichia coli]
MLDLQYEHFRLQVDLSGSRLTAKEKDVIGLLLAGHSVKAISIMRNRSLKTVSSQKQSAYKKLGVRSDIGLFLGLLKGRGMLVCHRSEEPVATAGQINTGAEQGYRYRCCRSGDVDEYRK